MHNCTIQVFHLPRIELRLGFAATNNIRQQLTRLWASAVKYLNFTLYKYEIYLCLTFYHRRVLEEDHQLAVELCQSSESITSRHIQIISTSQYFCQLFGFITTSYDWFNPGPEPTSIMVGDKKVVITRINAVLCVDDSSMFTQLVWANTKEVWPVITLLSISASQICTYQRVQSLTHKYLILLL